MMLGKHARFLVAVIVLWLLSFGTSASSQAQSGGQYQLSWGGVGAGGEAGGGQYVLAQTAGAAEGGQLTGGAYTLDAGTVGGGSLVAATGLNRLYLPFIRR